LTLQNLRDFPGAWQNGGVCGGGAGGRVARLHGRAHHGHCEHWRGRLRRRPPHGGRGLEALRRRGAAAGAFREQCRRQPSDRGAEEGEGGEHAVCGRVQGLLEPRDFAQCALGQDVVPGECPALL